jgi:hypothetical protein
MNKAIFLVDLKEEAQGKKYFSFNKLASTALTSTLEGRPCAFDETKTYNIGDKCVVVTDDGEIIIVACVHDNVSGPFNRFDWEEWNIADELQGLYDDYAIVSMNRPSLRRNKLWFQLTAKNAQDVIEDLGLNDTAVMIVNNFIISRKQPAMNSRTIWGAITEDL